MSEAQRTDAWLAKRAGKITASRAKDAMAFSKRAKTPEPLQARLDYAAELVIERLTGKSIGVPMTEAMRWGVDCEPLARTAYEAATGALVAETGFVPHKILSYVGASPDGLVGRFGLVEIKAPFNQRVHLKTLLDGMPEEHMAQVQCQLWVLERDWCDFVSFDPRLPDALQLHVQRVPRDDKFIAALSDAVKSLNDEVETMLAKLRAGRGLAEAA